MHPHPTGQTTAASDSRGSLAIEVAEILDSPEFAVFIRTLDDAYLTGRRGYTNRSLVGACLVKSLYRLPFWSRTARLIAEHAGLREALGGAPSVFAIYRFKEKLTDAHAKALDACINSTLCSLKASHPGFGVNVAIDSTDLVAYSNSQPTLYKNGPRRMKFSDPDASQGKRSATSTRAQGYFFGYKLHMAVCAETELPVGWQVVTAKLPDSKLVPRLIYEMERHGIKPSTAAMDKAYDSGEVYRAFDEMGCVPVVPLREIAYVKQGKHLKPLQCEHGWLRFGGTDYGRKRTKWLCPTGECKTKTKYIKGNRYHPLIPRSSPRWEGLRRGRSAIEREFGRLKNDFGLTPLRIRRLERVRLHVDLCVLAKLASALARARAVPLAA